jgi:predicted pyridoxine 5'-phosphate oxidase superfamily flavin-nucleotide-binding protein
MRMSSDNGTPEFKDVVTTLDQLRGLMGEPSEIALRKDIGRLDEHCRAFIARAPFVLVATADLKGRCDVSPKGDAPGFVLVLDDRHLLIPDRPGNKRFDGMRNLLENPGIGLSFLVPGSEETHVGRILVLEIDPTLERADIVAEVQRSSS